MPQRLWVGPAAKPGPEHYRRRINRQDQVFFFRYDKWVIGAIADGCSNSRLSEAGAAQLVHAATQALWVLVDQGVPFEKMAGAFDRQMGAFIHQTVAAYPGGAQFLSALTIYDRKVDLSQPHNFLVYSMVAELLQATVLAVCIHEDAGGVVLIRGDGSVQLDGKLTVFDYKNWPPYLSYLLAIKGQEYPGNPEDIHSKVIAVPSNFERLAVMTDGWPWHLGAEADPFDRWKFHLFGRWLRDENKQRQDANPPKRLLSEDEGWLLYRPDEVDDLARKLVKQHAEVTGTSAFTDDISGLILQKEVFQ